MRGLFIALWLLTGCDLLKTDDAVEYTVVRGDTLTRIARAHDVTVEQIQVWNGLSDDRIEVGQRLTIRASAAPTSPTPVVSKRGPRATTTPGSSLRLPKAKPCLRGPSLDDLDEDVPDIQSSVGLSMAQVRAPMRSAVAKLGDCIEGAWPDAVVELSISVACNGRVSAVEVLDGGGVSSNTLGCFQECLRYAAFPAHDMPDGFQFRYPLTLSAQ